MKGVLVGLLLSVAPAVRADVKEVVHYKELHSPVVIDLDASFCRDSKAAALDKWLPLDGLEPFYADGATISDPAVLLHQDKRTGQIEATVRFNVYVLGGRHDKYVDFTFSLVPDPSSVIPIDDPASVYSMEVEEGHRPKRKELKFLLSPGECEKASEPKLRIEMTVEDD